MNSLQYCKAKQEPTLTDEKRPVTISIPCPHIPLGNETESRWHENVEHGVSGHEEPLNHIQHDGSGQIEVTDNKSSANPGVRSSPSNELLIKRPQERVTAAPETEPSIVHDENENLCRREEIGTLRNEVEDGRTLHLDQGAISQESDCIVKKDVCLLSMRRLPYLLKRLSGSKNTGCTVTSLFELAKARNWALGSYGYDKEHPDHKDLWALRNQLLKLFDGKLSLVSADEHGATEEQSLRADLIGKMIDDPITKKVVSVLQAVEEDDTFKKIAVAKWEKKKETPIKNPKKKANKKQKFTNKANAGKKRKKVDTDDKNGDGDECEVPSKKAKSSEKEQTALETELLLCKQRRLELDSAQRREELKAQERELDRNFELKKRKLELIKVDHINQQECVQNFASLLSKFGKILQNHGPGSNSIS